MTLFVLEVYQNHFNSQAPSTSWLTVIAALQTVSWFYSYCGNRCKQLHKSTQRYDAETFLAANCVPGTTTLYIDMDGVLTNYYQAIAAFNSLTTWFCYDV